MKLSIIIAIYQRKDELNELLDSLSVQICSDFEVVIVDDGSTVDLKEVIDYYQNKLDIKYFKKINSGPGLSRNYGMERSSGDYFIFLDSDTIIPKQYICEVIKELNKDYVDFFGGSDASQKDFSDLQKAITFSMTSILTTGGIRGGKKNVSKFQPRSFNMGISRKAYNLSGGFSNMRVGEDPDLSMKLWENSLRSRWFSNAYVYHKRRTSISQYAKQIKSFGVARPILNKRHPDYVSFTFWFPSLFIVGLMLSLILLLYGFWQGILVYSVYFMMILLSSSLEYKSIKVGLLSIITTLIQFSMYGFGFLKSYFYLNILNKDPQNVFPNYFYKN